MKALLKQKKHIQWGLTFPSITTEEENELLLALIKVNKQIQALKPKQDVNCHTCFGKQAYNDIKPDGEIIAICFEFGSR